MDSGIIEYLVIAAKGQISDGLRASTAMSTYSSEWHMGHG